MAKILSQRTTYTNEKKAFDRMMEQFGDWQGIMEAPEEELTQAISSSNYPEVKAPGIQHILRQVKEEQGNSNLEFLGEIPLQEAIDWLTALPGAGHKTSTFVMFFTFRKPLLPGNTYVHGVSQRLGIIGPKVS